MLSSISSSIERAVKFALLEDTTRRHVYNFYVGLLRWGGGGEEEAEAHLVVDALAPG
jgi:hypothetical protein